MHEIITEIIINTGGSIFKLLNHIKVQRTLFQ